MKFPITRESLQAFDPVKNKAEKDEIAIQAHINSLVQVICGEIEHIISGAGLIQNPRMSHTTSSILSGKLIYEKVMSKKQFVWKEIVNIRRPPIQYGGNYKIEASESVLIPRLIEKLKETFIGCDIIIDPLNTYIIIDWS